MMTGKSCVLVSLMLLLTIHSSLSLPRCKKHELEALLQFKHSFTQDPQGLLSSWIGVDCCHWRGVSCDGVTGDVINLNLGNSPGYIDYSNSLISSELSSALLELKFLTHLDLSYIDFNGSRIPKFIGSMTKLRYINFSGAGFSGPIPLAIGNLTNLKHLDLSAGNYMVYTQERLGWASGLFKLRSLNMDYRNLSQANDSLKVLFRLPSLLTLSLSDCSLHSHILSENLITNSSTLQHLDLGYNNFEGHFPPFLKNLPSLQSLSLGKNSISGYLPRWLGNMRRLQYLDLSENSINGKMPSQLGQLLHLNYLDLSYNGFHGRIPRSLANLSALKHLDLSNNEFHGQVPSSLAKLFALKHLDLSNNELSGLIMPNILWQLTELEYLDISSNSIHGTISHIGNLSKLSTLNMNFNNIKLDLSTNWRPPFQLKVFGANSCEMNMVFPHWLRNQTQIRDLDLSYAGISGELPQWLWNLTSLEDLQLAGNKLTGSLPRHITCDGCKLKSLVLDNNMLSGTIPLWLKRLTTIFVLDLSKNLLSGGIFEGQNASSLLSGRNFLVLLDLSDNMLSGEVQVMNPDRAAFLEFLSLRANDFSGRISSQFCHFTYLAILDLAHNRLTGGIPRCLGSLIFDNYGYEVDIGSDIKIQEIIKGTTENLAGTLSAHSMIDLSCNRLVGTIPDELTNISKLMQLNLSNNHLTGCIPDDIGSLQLLESLDLSNNNISGTIPQSLSDIPWLSVLNLSFNHLYGPIPTGHQLQTLDNPCIYAGNSGLCGFPLSKKCSKSNSLPSSTNDDHGAEQDDDAGDKNDKLWLYLAIMSGVATGFWGVVGTLVLKKSWRHAYFRFVEETADRIYVPFRVRLNRLRRT